MAKESTYDAAQIVEKLKDLPGWTYQGGWIHRTYITDGWPTTLMLVNLIGYLAEAGDHGQGLRAGTPARCHRTVASGRRGTQRDAEKIRPAGRCGRRAVKRAR